MDKNKIKNKLQKIYNRSIEPSDSYRPPEQHPSLRKNQSFMFKSARRGKLSLSKDLSSISNQTVTSSHEHSLRERKKTYLNLVSNSYQKDLQFLSSSKICIANNDQITQRSKNKQKGEEKNAFFHQERKSHNRNHSSFDVRQLRDLAINIAESTAILNGKIVPVLLQAATHTLKSEKTQQFQFGSMFLASTANIQINPQNKRQTHHKKQLMLQTPINQLKYQSFDQNEYQQAYVSKSPFNRCQTQPNTSILSYKNKHKLQHSPVPIKNKSTYLFDRNSSKNHTRNNSENDRIFTEANADKIDSFMNLAKQLQSINSKRKAVENRIDKKLDQLSNKAHSMTKKHSARYAQNEECPKKPKILTYSIKTNIDDNEVEIACLQRSNVKNRYNLNDKNPITTNQPSKRNKNIRNIIINRIFS